MLTEHLHTFMTLLPGGTWDGFISSVRASCIQWDHSYCQVVGLTTFICDHTPPVPAGTWSEIPGYLVYFPPRSLATEREYWHYPSNLIAEVSWLCQLSKVYIHQLERWKFPTGVAPDTSQPGDGAAVDMEEDHKSMMHKSNCNNTSCFKLLLKEVML